MGLNPRKRGRGFGRRGSFFNQGQWGNGTSQEPIFSYGLDSSFSPGTSFGQSLGFKHSSGPKMNPMKPMFGKFLKRNPNRRQSTISNVLRPPVPFREKDSNFKNYYCESCDKSFRTENDLLVHKADHEICNRDGCAFTAHPKIIVKHIKMQHESGLYRRIGNLYTEEDIAKWIEERKKRYPTRKVIEDKKLLEEEKLKRGERIKDDEPKFNKSFSNRNRKIRKKNFGKKMHTTTKTRRTRRKKETSFSHKHLGEQQVEDYRKGVPAFLGIGNANEPEFLGKNELNISDDEWDTECKTPNIAKPLVNTSLGLLAKFYNSDEDNVIQESQKEVIDSISADEESGPEEVHTVYSKNLLPKEKSNENKIFSKKNFFEKKEINKRKRENTINFCTTDKRTSTLLEKLLKKEIRHERNIILQCIHYIVNHNFFKT